MPNMMAGTVVVEKIKVRAGKNGPVHIEGGRREIDADGNDVNVIREGQVADVPNTHYYRRMVAMGDLVVVTEKE